jgi:hypothetical protein
LDFPVHIRKIYALCTHLRTRTYTHTHTHIYTYAAVAYCIHMCIRISTRVRIRRPTCTYIGVLYCARTHTHTLSLSLSLSLSGTALSQELVTHSVRSKVKIPPPSRIENFNLAGKLRWQTWRAMTDVRLMHVFGSTCRDSRKMFRKKLLPAQSYPCPSSQRARRPPINFAVTGPRSLHGKTRP